MGIRRTALVVPTATIMMLPLACADSRDDEGMFGGQGEDPYPTDGTAGDDAGDDGGGGDGGDDGADDGGDGVRFDTPDGEGGPGDGGGPCGCGQSEWSYIWVANSGESTVSKINTRTMEEEGRYLTREDGAGNPSRTSVSISGRAVAVANRRGGLVKVWAKPEFCDPMRNGTPGLQTSSGATDVLPWGEDDCVDWYTDFTYQSQRPVAWMAGQMNPDTCEYENERVWTSGCGPGAPKAHLVDGDDGAVLETIDLTGVPCMTEAITFGAYGGAVDGAGHFWLSTFAQYGQSKLARVDKDTLGVQVWNAPIPGYGITVDRQDRPWLNGNGALGANAGTRAARFDPTSQTWELAKGGAVLGQSGLAEDIQGRMWMNYWDSDLGGGGGGLTYVDSSTMDAGPKIDLGAQSKGVSVDVDGYVWAIALDGRAIRFDADTNQTDTYGGLKSPYTYSDMTGWALQNANCKPEG